MRRICVFCGARPGKNPAYVAAARLLGEALARHQIELVYGGGHVGLMGAVADAVLKAGGKVIGVIPEFLVAREQAHPGVTELIVVPSMHERKAQMAELADGFIAMPGGYGTFEELCEILTWAQLGLHQKPHGLLNVAGYYDALIQLFDHSVAQEFLSPDARDLLIEETEPVALLDRMLRHYQMQGSEQSVRQIRDVREKF
jgi:uncharacterized protein (TIGR00730 family)